jgi:UPF0755 protein
MIRLVLTVLVAMVLLASGSALWVWQGLKSLDEPAPVASTSLFQVPEGSSFGAIAYAMEEQGLIERAFWLKVWGRLDSDAQSIKAGQYEFQPGISARGMVRKMVRGDTKIWTVQFIEGWRFRELRQALAAHKQLQSTTEALSDAELMDRLGAPDRHPEGLFFPDTYVFDARDTDLDILQRAYNRMQDTLSEEWANRDSDLPYDTPYEALIMASIIEKETGVPRERGRIAGVFVRRLQKGMRLQTDPTVIYGLGENYDGNITRKHLQTTTPYNTYRISGLPPTPIALPGREAIHAALHPADGSALYFVARGDGSHTFSDTFKAHQEAVRQYQIKRRRSDYRSSPAPSANNPDPSGNPQSDKP